MKKPMLILLLLAHTLLQAQDNRITLQEAVESGLQRNPGLRELYSVLDQKRNTARQETGIDDPEVSYFREGISNGPGDIFDEQRVTISQSIDFPLTTAYRMKGIREEVTALENEVKAREKMVRAEVKSSYVEVIYALRLQLSRQNQVTILTDLHKAVSTKMELGMASGIDLTSIELQLQEALNDLDQSEFILHKARYNLFYAMGLPVPEQTYDITFSDSLNVIEVEVDQIMTLSMLEQQPEYQSTLHELQAARLFLKEAKSNVMPDLRLNLYRQDYGSGYDFTGFEVGVSIPLWYPLAHKGRINASAARVEEVGWKQDRIRLELKRELEHAWHNYDISRKIINRYRDTMRSRATELQRLSLRAYQLGEIDLLRLLNARQVFLNGEQHYLAAMRDYYLQLIALERYLGRDLVQ
jgi:cobalt-zinc-cadmium efflux system outer membrane protein